MTKKQLTLSIPKGRLYADVAGLLAEAGLILQKNGRNYRPSISDPDIKVKLLKPQNIPKLVELGSQDVAFTGFDWVAEQVADVQELMDLEFNPVKLIAAIPKDRNFEDLTKAPIRVASEYENITKKFLTEEGLKFVFIKSFGATENFIPEDADLIVDNSSTGTTLKDNGLVSFKEILYSSTRLIANKDSLKDPWKSQKIKELVLLIQSVLDGRKRFLIEMNVNEQNLAQLLPNLPCMKSPTISKLYGDNGYAIKIAVKKDQVSKLIPFLKLNGATDILVFNLRQVIP